MKDFRNAIPIALSSIFLFVILGLSYQKFSAWDAPMATFGWLVSISYILWLVLESKIAVCEVNQSTTSKDRGTCEAYASGRVLVMLSILIFPSLHTEFNIFIVIGYIIFISGVTFRLISIHTLGQFYSHRVRITHEHQVIQRGPYSLIRHPAYTGMLLAHIGAVMALFNWYGLVTLLFILAPAIVLRIRIEEKALFKLSEYHHYAKTHSRLIPMIW